MAVSQATTSILFTDLVSSTELMQRAGDEDAQRVFKAHYRALRDAVAANGGAEIKTLGDGLMVAFNAAADAVRCAVMMQQASRRPIDGERLSIRVGINAGDALRDAGDLFGTPVVVAQRLCGRAGPGQILCSAVVESLLAGRQAFSFKDVGELELKGFSAPVDAREVLYETERRGAFVTRTPFVGREAEMARLQARLDETRAGRGGLVLLVGEPGIGKSRAIEEFCERAQAGGAMVLWGRCFEGEWAPPYGPFAEAIAGYAKDADRDALRNDLGYGGPAIARLVPAVREALPDVPEPAPLQPDEERFRLFDAVSQFLLAVSQRAPVVLVLDDLHWADRGTIAMLRHVARFATKQRTLILGAYRDVELDRQHPLAGALAHLRREAEYERLSLKGLDRDGVGRLISSIAEHDVPEAFVQAISDETDGNPFFIREVLIHLADEGKIFQEDGRWTARLAIAEMGIPEGVRQVISRRLTRLSEDANKLLTAASGFNGGFNFLTLAIITEMDEDATLGAVDEALAAQLLQPTGQQDYYDFTHALIRHTLYGEMNPSRQVRLHRKIAEAYEQRNTTPEAKARHAAEMAYQFHRSAAIPGAERGAGYALAAAEAADAAAAWDESAAFLRMAVDLLPAGEAQRPRILARLAIALARSLAFEEAARVASEAADLLAGSEGRDAAADYLSEAARAIGDAGSQKSAWSVARKGLELIGDRRDESWAWMQTLDIARRAAEDPNDLGITLDTPERLEVAAIIKGQLLGGFTTIRSRADVLAEMPDNAFPLTFFAGEYARVLPMWNKLAREQEQSGQVAIAAASWAQLSRTHTALGNLAEADVTLTHARSLAARLSPGSVQAIQLLAAGAELAGIRGATDAGVSLGASDPGDTLAALMRDPETRWVAASLRAGIAAVFAANGRRDEAIGMLKTLVQPIEQAPGWAVNYQLMIGMAQRAASLISYHDMDDVFERNLIEKLVVPDFHYPSLDARLSLADVCAGQRRYDEAIAWFVKARAVLEEHRARPLRAMCDHLEAMLYMRRDGAGDRGRARELFEAALAQFREIGMTGWIARAEEALREL